VTPRSTHDVAYCGIEIPRKEQLYVEGETLDNVDRTEHLLISIDGCQSLAHAHKLSSDR
jgi:hypothetical protein